MAHNLKSPFFSNNCHLLHTMAEQNLLSVMDPIEKASTALGAFSMHSLSVKMGA
jgi:hypothetical protein